jgi:hypothetical protein
MTNQPRNKFARPQAAHRSRSPRAISLAVEGVDGESPVTLKPPRKKTISTPEAADLPPPSVDGTVRAMYTVARLFQIVGLVIPPLAIMAQLNESITQGQMLGFLVAAICSFMIGQTLQRTTGRGS